MEFTRYYNSQIKETGSLGYGFTSNLFYSLQVGDTIASFMLPSGYTMAFKYDTATNTFSPEEGYTTDYSIQSINPQADSAQADSYIVSHKDGTNYIFNSDCNLTEIVQNGKTMYIYEYTSEKAIKRVTGQYGAYFDFETFEYTAMEGDSIHLISKVTDYANNEVKFVYDGNLLKQSINPDNDSITYSYDSEGNMNEITDFMGRVYLTNTYDDKGRVLTQYIAGQGMSTMAYDDENRVTTATEPTRIFR